MKTVLDCNNFILGNFESKVDINIPNLKDAFDFVLNSANGLYDISIITKTKSSIEFYKNAPMLYSFIRDRFEYIKTLVDGNITFQSFISELFHSMSLKEYIPNIPMLLYHCIVYTRDYVETPNMLVKRIDKNVLRSYADSAINGSKTVIKELVDYVFGYDVQLLTKDTPYVDNNGVREIYVSNNDSILLCDESISKYIQNIEDYHRIVYNKDLGMCIGDSKIPIRCIISDYGILPDDYDLRKVLQIS